MLTFKFLPLSASFSLQNNLSFKSFVVLLIRRKIICLLYFVNHTPSFIFCKKMQLMQIIVATTLILEVHQPLLWWLFKSAFFLAMVSFTSSFHHHMSHQSLLRFLFTHTSSHAFRTHPWKVFHKSSASVLISSFILFSNLTLVRFSFSFHSFFLTIFLEPFCPDL